VLDGKDDREKFIEEFNAEKRNDIVFSTKNSTFNKAADPVMTIQSQPNTPVWSVSNSVDPYSRTFNVFNTANQELKASNELTLFYSETPNFEPSPLLTIIPSEEEYVSPKVSLSQSNISIDGNVAPRDFSSMSRINWSEMAKEVNKTPGQSPFQTPNETVTIPVKSSRLGTE